MRMNDVGPKTYAQGIAVSSLAYQPPFDRELIVTRVYITAPSATDKWTISIGGRVIHRHYILSSGTQQTLGAFSTSALTERDLFTWYKAAFGDDLILPVPRGMQIVVASEGGATADVTIEGEDVTPGTINPTMLNHYQGNRFIMPVYGYLNAGPTAAGEKAFDTNVSPSWVGSIFTGVAFPVGQRARILALFLEAAGVNTYSGSSDARSRTDHIGIVKDGQRLFSHVLAGMISGGAGGITTVPAANYVAPEGIPAISEDAATGSANTVFERGSNPFPSIQSYATPEENKLDPPLEIKGGSNVQFYLGTTGTYTGTPSYATTLAMALLEVFQPSGV